MCQTARCHVLTVPVVLMAPVTTFRDYTHLLYKVEEHQHNPPMPLYQLDTSY